MHLFLAPFPVVLPFSVAIALLGFERLLPKRAIDAAAIATALATAIVAALLARQALVHPMVYWFGGWRPNNGIALGISFVVDPAGAMLTTFAALLFVAAFVYGWGYLDDVGAHYHTLMLVFLGAIAGFCLTGDIFNLFVFFELMSVVAFALTAAKLEAASIEGALNFTVVNMIGSFSLLGGIGLLYGQTGALNLAQIGQAIGTTSGDPLLAMSFVLIFTGLLTKAAVMPFHFWLADAHAVAPTPVSVLFSGIMVGLGLFGAGRLYWTVFSQVASITHVVHTVALYMGVGTAILAGLNCLAQRHIKRLFAFSTISHIGVMLTGMALLNNAGTSGFLLYLIGHGLIKGGLFMIAGVLLALRSDIDEHTLQGRAKDLPVTGLALALGGLLLAGLPIGLMDAGKTIMDSALAQQHGWLPYALTLSSALTGAAVLRVYGRVFLGLGPEPDKDTVRASKPDEAEKARPMFLLLGPVFLLYACNCLLTSRASDALAFRAAQDFTGHQAYIDNVLGMTATATASPPTSQLVVIASLPPHASSMLGWVGTGLAITLAAFALYKHRLPALFTRAIGTPATPIYFTLKRVHSNHIGDYVVWLIGGMVILSYAFLI